MSDTDDILKKYGAKIDRQMKNYNKSSVAPGKFSRSYEMFRSSMMPEFSRYERWCKSLGNIFTMKLGEKDDARISRSIEIAHLNVSSSEVVVFAVVLMFLTMFGGSLLVTGIWFLGGGLSLGLLFLFFWVS